jgi:hypothetical protein
MTTKHPIRGLLHRATHRVPGVPAHAEHPAGHQGPAVHEGTAAPGRARRVNHGWNHSPARPPRFLPAWQRRIAALFGREVG